MQGRFAASSDRSVAKQVGASQDLGDAGIPAPTTSQEAAPAKVATEIGASKRHASASMIV